MLSSIDLVNVCRSKLLQKLHIIFVEEADVIDLIAEHGDAFGQFLRRSGKIHVLLEPVKSDFHSEVRLKVRKGLDNRKFFEKADA
jgi:hypothetical protein